MVSQESGLFPLAVFLSVLLFALLAWCILSSCMGRSILSSMSELWDMIILGVRSGGGGHHVRQRMNADHWEDDELFEMEYRGRARTGVF
ncbi:hypothetical protein BD311DRAFT_755732 [Dichomitus squalens]|uniref:Uncharacterized protein n=1 Tax=Dichomitus squalens TaxID=114155 RepID=A0A4Q9MPV2_9APHY|nr:hypothetical protein BD311DRAFT_755732 [Dichomitus squalens]